MQIKPHFKEYNEISRTPFIKDDRGNQYSLVHFNATKEDHSDSFHYEISRFINEDESVKSVNRFRRKKGTVQTTTYEGYVVLCDQLKTHSNGITSYDDTLYWKEPKKLQQFEIDNLLLVEIMTGQNDFFKSELPTMNTKFTVYERESGSDLGERV